MKETYKDACGLIALELAEIFIKNDLEPNLYAIRGKPVDSRYISANHPLVPRQYEGKITWGGHTVCELGGIIYDPIPGRPMSLEEYKKSVFEDDVDCYMAANTEEIKNMLKR